MHRLLTESATPEEVAVVNDLIAQVRLHWRLACAWSRVDPATFEGHFTNDNPYAPDYYAAVRAYDKHRGES